MRTFARDGRCKFSFAADLPAVKKAKALLAKGMTSIKSIQSYRQVQIWLDGSGNYIEDELSDGKDDEERIQGTDFIAGKKLKSALAANKKSFQANKKA